MCNIEIYKVRNSKFCLWSISKRMVLVFVFRFLSLSVKLIVANKKIVFAVLLTTLFFLDDTVVPKNTLLKPKKMIQVKLLIGRYCTKSLEVVMVTLNLLTSAVCMSGFVNMSYESCCPLTNFLLKNLLSNNQCGNTLIYLILNIKNSFSHKIFFENLFFKRCY